MPTALNVRATVELVPAFAVSANDPFACDIACGNDTGIGIDASPPATTLPAIPFKEAAGLLVVPPDPPPSTVGTSAGRDAFVPSASELASFAFSSFVTASGDLEEVSGLPAFDATCAVVRSRPADAATTVVWSPVPLTLPATFTEEACTAPPIFEGVVAEASPSWATDPASCTTLGDFGTATPVVAGITVVFTGGAPLTAETLGDCGA